MFRPFPSALVGLTLVAVTPARAQVTMPLNVNGTLIIGGGGNNSSIVTYTTGLIAPGSSTQTIALSTAFPNLVIRGGATPGQSCKNGGDCWTTDFCEDGVCCCNCSPGQTSINGVAYVTCYAAQYPSASCPLYGDNNAAGTSYQCGNCAACNQTSNGTCAAASTSRSSGRTSATCRPSVDVCDVAEACNGTAQLCPPDGFAAAGTQCRVAFGQGCDLPATCTGSGPACPPNPLEPAGTTCRAQDLTHCRATAICTGSSNVCPTGALLAAGTLCQPAQGPCALPGRCDGATASCPTLFLSANIVCDPSGATCSGSSANCPNASGWGNQACQ
jgi:hypothetical protein